jgi:hypothetical protein
MLGADLFRAFSASVLLGAVETGLESGCGSGRERQHTHRGTVGEALPRGLPADPKLGADVSPRHPGTASMGDEVIQQPVGGGGVLSTDRNASPEQHGRSRWLTIPFALVQGYLFNRTRSLLYIVSTHLIFDCVLFLVLLPAHKPGWLPIFVH